MKKAKVISIFLIAAIVLVLFPYSVFAASAPNFSLAEDTGVSEDNISSNGQMNVGGLEAGATWEYSVNSGANWSTGAGTSFILSDGTYPAGTIQVRQTVDGSTSAAGSNTSEIVIAQNQIYNGDFQAGYAGFTSEYSYLGECQTEGTYAVVTYAQEVHPAFSIVYDHTYGTISGKYFVANGALVSGQTLWQSTSPITVEAGVAYRFEAYLMSLTADTNGFPRVRFQIGDGTNWADLGTTNVAWVTNEKNIWHSIYADGQFNTAGTYYIRLLNDQTQQYNDLGVDDIYFGLRGAAPTASDPGTNPTLPPPTFDTSTMLSMELAADTGISDSDNITSNGQVNVTGWQYAWQYSINGGGWMSGSGSSFTVTGDGSKSVTVRQMGADELWQPASAPLVFTLDTTAPTVAITSSKTSPTNAVPIPVTITFSESVTGFELGDITVGNGSASNLLGSGASYTADITPSADGTVTVDVAGAVVQDLAGNGNTAATQFSIVSDTQPPTGISIAIVSGATYTNSNAVTISLTATGASQVILSENSDFSGAGYEPYAANKPFGLSTGDGTKTVYAKFRDAAGNETSVIYDTIILDTTPPTAIITSTETSPTNAALIPFTVTFSEHVTSTPYLVYNGTVDHSSISGNIYTYYIDPTSDGAVTFKVSLKSIYDDAGNIDFNAEDVQLSIVSDTIAPTGTSISINSGAAYTNSTSVPLTLGATGASEMMISENSNFSGASYEAYSASKAFTLSSTDGTKTVYVKYKDEAGNVSEAVSDTIVLDTTPPTVAITTSKTDPTNAVPIPATITFSEAVTGFTVSDLAVGNGSAGNFSGSGTTYTVDITPSADGVVTVDIAANVAVDVASNVNTAATQFSIVSDTTAPTVTVTSTETSPTNAALIPFTVTISEDTTGLVFEVENGTPDHNSTHSGNTYVFYVAPTDDGPVTFKVVANHTFDDAGNFNQEDVQCSVVSDRTAPTVTITTTESDPTKAVPIPVTITFSEDVTGFDVSDITVGNGSTDNFSGSGTTYTADITPDADGTVTVDLAEGVCTDLAGNNNTAATQLSIVSDTLAPTDTSISINEADAYTNSTSVTLTLGATGASEMIISEDSSFSGASYEAYSTSKAFTLSAGDGTKTIYVKYKDDAGNESAAISDTIELDTLAPTDTSISINSADAYANSTSVTLTLGAKGASEMMISESSDFSGASYETYAVSKVFELSSGDSTKTIYVKYKDAAGNESVPVSDTIELDMTAPTVVITTAEPDPTKTVPITITIEFSEDVTGFELGDITVSNGIAGNFIGSGTTYTADIAPYADGTVTVDIAEDEATDIADNGNTAAVQLSIVSDTLAPTDTSILINKGKIYTFSRYVTLTLSATGVSEMMVSEDENFDGASYRTYSDNMVFKLSSGYGTKTVYVKYKDEAGNVTTETISDTIKYTSVPDDPDEDESDDSDVPDASGDSDDDGDEQNGDDLSDDDQQNEEGDQEGSAGESSNDQGGTGALGTISGYLVDTQGNPIAGVLVELHSDPRQTYTDDEGFFLFENVEPGEHTIFIIDERLDSAYSTKVEFIKDDSGQPQMQEYKNDLQKDGIPIELEGITKLEIYFVMQEAAVTAFAWQWLLIIPAAALFVVLIFFIRRRRQDKEESGSY